MTATTTYWFDFGLLGPDDIVVYFGLATWYPQVDLNRFPFGCLAH